MTDEIKADGAALWAKLLRAYEENAHGTLGYSSWHEYAAEEFGVGKSRAYQFLDAGKVMSALDAHSNMLERPMTDRVARELLPVLEEGPERVQEVWGEAVAEHGPTPTAARG